MNEKTKAEFLILFVIVVIIIVPFATAVSFAAGEIKAEERICNNAGGVLVERSCINRKALIDIRGDYR